MSNVSIGKAMRIVVAIVVLVPHPSFALSDVQINNTQWAKGKAVFLYSKEFKTADRSEIESLLTEVNQLLKSNPANPGLVFVKGKALRSSLAIWVYEQQQQGKRAQDQPEFVNQKTEYLSYYQKALTLNADPKTQYRLTLSMLSSIGNDVLATADIKAQAYRQLIKLPPELYDIESDQPEDYPYGLYKAMIGAYLKEDRYDDAIKVWDEIQNIFPFRKEQAIKAKKAITEHKQAWLEKKSGQVASKTAQSPQPKVFPDTSVAEESTSDETTKDRSLPKVVNYKLIAILIGILILIVVSSIALYNWKKKSKA